MIQLYREIQTAKSGDWLSGGGECCGFDAFVQEDKIICEDRRCGYGTIWQGSLLLSEVCRVAASIKLLEIL